MTDDMIDKITPQLLGKKPNTYTFTKAIAEHKIMELGKGLPICVVRPSIVGAAWKDPFPVGVFMTSLLLCISPARM